MIAALRSSESIVRHGVYQAEHGQTARKSRSQSSWKAISARGLARASDLFRLELERGREMGQ
eukprot:599289-Hanusia_phi.AAC.1